MTRRTPRAGARARSIIVASVVALVVAFVPSVAGADPPTQTLTVNGVASAGGSFTDNAPYGVAYNPVITSDDAAATITYTASSAVCTGSNASGVTFESVGVCEIDITSTPEAESPYDPATATLDVTVGPGTQTLEVNGASATNNTFADTAPFGTSYTPNFTTNDPNSVTSYSVDPSSAAVCAGSSPASITFSGLGPCVVDLASTAGPTGNFASANGTLTITVQADVQTLTFKGVTLSSGTFTDTATFGTTYNPSITSNDPTAVVTYVTNSSTCSGSNTTGVTFESTGACAIDVTATPASGDGFSPVTATLDVTVAAESQTLEVNGATATNNQFSVAAGFGSPYTPNLTTNDPNSATSYSVDPSSAAVCSGSSPAPISFTSVGQCEVDLTSTPGGTSNFLPATGSLTITVGQTVLATPVISGVTATATYVAVSFAAVPNATSYVATVNFGAVVASTNATSCSQYNCLVGGLTADTQYTVQVTAIGTGGFTSSPASAATTFATALANSQPTTGPPNAPPPSGVAAIDLGTPSSSFASCSTATTVTLDYEGITATLHVPSCALPTGTTVSIYPVADASTLTPLVASGQYFVTAIGVSWLTPTGTVPASSASLTLTINDSSIVAGDAVDVLTSGALVSNATTEVAGSATVSFDNDPIFVVTGIAKSNQPALRVTSTQGTVGKPLTLTTDGGAGTGATTYEVSDGTASGCTLNSFSPYTLSVTSPGTCGVTATKAADTNFNAVTSSTTTVTFTAVVVPQKFSVTSVVGTVVRGASSIVEVVGTGLDKAGAASASNQVTVAIVSRTDTKLSLVVRINKSAGPGNYRLTVGESSGEMVPIYFTLPAGAGRVTSPVTLSVPPPTKVAQATLVVLSIGALKGTTVALRTAGGSGSGTVTYAVVAGTAKGCQLVGASASSLHATSVGTCLVRATKSGDANHTATTSGPGVITFHAPKVAPTFAVTAVSGSLRAGSTSTIVLNGVGFLVGGHITTSNSAFSWKVLSGTQTRLTLQIDVAADVKPGTYELHVVSKAGGQVVVYLIMRASGTQPVSGYVSLKS